MKSMRTIVLILIDIVLVSIALYGSLLLRFDGSVPDQYMQAYIIFNTILAFICVICFYIFGLYNRLWQYASVGELVSVISAVTIASVATVIATYFISNTGTYALPRTIIVLSWAFNIILIGGSRLAWRLYREYFVRVVHGNKKQVLIYGAGDSGSILARDFRSNNHEGYQLVGFLDDNPDKKNGKLAGYPVFGDRYQIHEVARDYELDEVIVAIPSLEGKIVREILSICQDLKVKVKIIPGISDLLEGNFSVNQIREVNIEDLLGRESVKVDLEGICDYLHGQVVLVTGAGGSIGSELCRQISTFSPKKLLILDHSENNVYDIEMELRNDYLCEVVYPIVKDIRDRAAIEGVFALYKPDVVFHAAAHKHVPLMEANPEEAIKNNVMGTYHVAKAADVYGAKKFVLISTDKAVNPTSIMGASKRVAEMFIQHLDKKSATNFVAVRFGNVLGSRGSVVPLFKKQIAEGGPITVTDENMVRYFMTIPESVQLVIQTGAMAEGGEIFVLDMGEPVKIIDLAESIIRLSGFEPYQDIDIQITGMRPGEKLYEELLTAEEGVNSTFHKRIFIGRPNGLKELLIENTMKAFIENRLPKTREETIEFLQAFIPTFHRVEYTLDAKSSQVMQDTYEKHKKKERYMPQNGEYQVAK